MELYGGSEDGRSLDQIPPLLDQLVDAEDEHPNVAVTHESGWSLGAYRHGYITFEHLDGEGGPFHMRNVSRERTIELMELVARGEVQVVLEHDWKSGYR